jgi:hypothetical protein
MPRSIYPFFRDFVSDLAEALFLQHVIDSSDCEVLRSFANSDAGKACAKALVLNGKLVLPHHPLTIGLKRLKELDGTWFWHLEVVPVQSSRRTRRICFLGHRFVPNVESRLRWNLAQVLEPYNVEVDWCGKDMRSVQILGDVTDRIAKAEFCIFDTRATAGKPNVHVEIGIAHALRRPFIIFDYVKRADQKSSMPSDLAHALTIRYTTYNELFRKFYFSLPLFFQRHLTAGGQGTPNAHRGEQEPAGSTPFIQ